MKIFRPLLLLCLSAALAFSAFVFVPFIDLGGVAFAQRPPADLTAAMPSDLVTPAVVADAAKILLAALLVFAVCLLAIRLISRLRRTPEALPFDGGFTDAWRLSAHDPGSPG